MAVVLVVSEDAHEVATLTGAIESIGHTALPLSSTENIAEDVVLNDVRLVLLAESLTPFSGWDSCEILRGDPTVARELPILMMVEGRGNVRRLEKCGFSGTIDSNASAAELVEEMVRRLGEYAAPESLDPLADLKIE